MCEDRSMSSLKDRVDRFILPRSVQPVRHNPPGKVVIDAAVAFSLCEVWTKVYSPKPGAGLTFPETVQRLSDIGVTRYRVDFVTNTTIAYIGGSAHLYHFPSYATEELVPGAIPWSLAKLREAIKKAREDAKNLKPDLPTYTRQIVEAGVCDYTCFIEGRRVTYTGYLGEQHSTWFMGAGPEVPNSASLSLGRRNTVNGQGHASRSATHNITSSPLRGPVRNVANVDPRFPNAIPGAVMPFGIRPAVLESMSSVNLNSTAPDGHASLKAASCTAEGCCDPNTAPTSTYERPSKPALRPTSTTLSDTPWTPPPSEVGASSHAAEPHTPTG